MNDSVLGRWTAGRPFVAFANARSAFAALVRLLGPACVWLPAYLCPEVLADGWRHTVQFYPVGRSLAPDVGLLDREAKAGDLILVIDYFGFSVGAAFIAFARRRRDLRFVEDRAQALDPGGEFWAQWCLYSPRKLLGVADGGILVPADREQPIPQCSVDPDAVGLWAAPMLRYEDSAEIRNDVWYAVHREKEAAMAVGCWKMTRLSAWILSRTSLEPLAGRRRRNWNILRERLGRWLAIDRDPDGAPFGFAIKVTPSRRPELLQSLHSERIFAAVHWACLPSQEELFPAEHDLCRSVITLPCDHRYDEPVMRQLGGRVAAMLS